MNWKTYLIAQTFGFAALSTLCKSAYIAFLWRGAPLLPLHHIGANRRVPLLHVLPVLAVLLGFKSGIGGGQNVTLPPLFPTS